MAMLIRIAIRSCASGMQFAAPQPSWLGSYFLAGVSVCRFFGAPPPQVSFGCSMWNVWFCFVWLFRCLRRLVCTCAHRERREEEKKQTKLLRSIVVSLFRPTNCGRPLCSTSISAADPTQGGVGVGLSRPTGHEPIRLISHLDQPSITVEEVKRTGAARW